jgi:hypothetical protein
MDARVFNTKAVMGDKTMFDLNNAINSWRMNLSEQQTCAKSDIDEMETHLREEIDSLTASKLSEQEAFLVATHRLGDADSLAAEFAKVNTSILWRKRLFWILAGMLTFIAARHLSSLALSGCYLLGAYGGLLGYGFGLVSEFIGIVVFCLTLFVFFSACRPSNTPRLDWLFRTLRGKVILCAAFGMVFIANPLVEVLSRALGARITSVEQWGQMMLVSALVRRPFQVLLFAGFMVLLIRLRSSNVRAAHQ